VNRVFDIAVASMGLLVLAPLLALIACVIWLSERRSAIYRGVRVGRHGRQFQILKFRTMRADVTVTRQLTVRDDPRVTRLGRFLRRVKLDELPQLLNVLWGDMSLVGPRPESPRYVVHYTPEQLSVLSVRPGITGASQIAFSHEERILCGPDPERYYIAAVMPAKLAIDLDYVEQRSFWLDLKILALTLVALVHPVRPLVPVGVSSSRTWPLDG
jgi:lipopolysaccharide/colanic/teichoic acid biosynthesis glycosyltransferase